MVYTTLPGIHHLYHPGYTMYIPYPAQQRVYIPVLGPVVRDRALGSKPRLITVMRDKEALGSPKV